MKAKELIEILKKYPEMDVFIQDYTDDCLEANSIEVCNLSDLTLEDSDVIFTKDYSSTTKLNKSYKVYEKYYVDLDEIIPIKKEDYVYVKDVLVIGCHNHIEKKEYNNKQIEIDYKKQQEEEKFRKKNYKEWTLYKELEEKFKSK